MVRCMLIKQKYSNVPNYKSSYKVLIILVEQCALTNWALTFSINDIKMFTYSYFTYNFM